MSSVCLYVQFWKCTCTESVYQVSLPAVYTCALTQHAVSTGLHKKISSVLSSSQQWLSKPTQIWEQLLKTTIWDKFGTIVEGNNMRTILCKQPHYACLNTLSILSVIKHKNTVRNICYESTIICFLNVFSLAAILDYFHRNQRSVENSKPYFLNYISWSSCTS